MITLHANPRDKTSVTPPLGGPKRYCKNTQELILRASARISRGTLCPLRSLDPAWDMLLELFVSNLTHRRVSVSGLSSASGVLQTTHCVCRRRPWSMTTFSSAGSTSPGLRVILDCSNHYNRISIRYNPEILWPPSGLAQLPDEEGPPTRRTRRLIREGPHRSGPDGHQHWSETSL